MWSHQGSQRLWLSIVPSPDILSAYRCLLTLFIGLNPILQKRNEGETPQTKKSQTPAQLVLPPTHPPPPPPHPKPPARRRLWARCGCAGSPPSRAARTPAASSESKIRGEWPSLRIESNRRHPHSGRTGFQMRGFSMNRKKDL